MSGSISDSPSEDSNGSKENQSAIPRQVSTPNTYDTSKRKPEQDDDTLSELSVGTKKSRFTIADVATVTTIQKPTLPPIPLKEKVRKGAKVPSNANATKKKEMESINNKIDGNAGLYLELHGFCENYKAQCHGILDDTYKAPKSTTRPTVKPAWKRRS